MPKRRSSKDLTPRLINALNDLFDNAQALSLGSSTGGKADFGGMYFRVDDELLDVVRELHEVLELQTRGGGPEQDGYIPADPVKVAHDVRKHALDKIVSNLTWRDDNGLHIIGVPNGGEPS